MVLVFHSTSIGLNSLTTPSLALCPSRRKRIRSSASTKSEIRWHYKYLSVSVDGAWVGGNEVPLRRNGLGHRVGYHLFICASSLIMKNVGIAASDGFLWGSAIIVCRHSFNATHGPVPSLSVDCHVPGLDTNSASTVARDRIWLSSGNSFNICDSAHIWTEADQLRDHGAFPNGFNHRTNNTKYAPSLRGSFRLFFSLSVLSAKGTVGGGL